MATGPTLNDLNAVAAFSERFAAPDFVAGEWIQPSERDDGVIQLGWWSPSDVVSQWEQALYDHSIVDPDSDYLGESNVRFVNRCIAVPELVADVELSTLRRILTFLVRAERHTGGGWFESAFGSGMAQAATRRLGVLAASASVRGE